MPGLGENVCGGGHGSYASEVYARRRNGHAMDALVADAGVADPEVGDEGQDGGDGEDVVDPALALVVAHGVGFGVAGVIADAELGADVPRAVAFELALVAMAGDLVAEVDGVLLLMVSAAGGEVAGMGGTGHYGGFRLGPGCGFFGEGGAGGGSA